MKVSFVIPAFNEEARIAMCIEAAQREIERAGLEDDVEIIVVNNASSDGTRTIAASYAGVQVVDESRKGLTYARQAGFSVSRGELIANVDADTLVPEGWLDTVIRSFDRNPRLAALSGPFIYYDLPTAKRLATRAFIASYPLVNFIMQYVLRSGAILQGGNFVLHRSALEKVGGFDTSIEFYGEDTDIARRISKVGRVKWTHALPILASGRRLAHEGVLKMGYRYALNFFWTTFTKRPWHTDHIDIRTP